MPDYPQAETDVHSGLVKPTPAIGTGTYQTGTAPMTSAQRTGNLRSAAVANRNANTGQKVKSYAPGQNPKIKGRTSFSDEMGD